MTFNGALRSTAPLASRGWEPERWFHEHWQRSPHRRAAHADLEAQIEQVKRRAAAKKAKRDPALRYVSGALRSIDKALASSEDQATRAALNEARVGMAAILTLSGVVVPAGRGRSGPRGSGQVVAEDALLAYIQAHPGRRTEEIAAGLGTATAGVKPALVGLKQAGRLVVEGKARATRYSVANR